MATRDEKLIIISTVVAGFAKLMYLLNKRYNDGGVIWTPMTDAENDELNRLQNWWRNMPPAKQEKIVALTESMATGCDLCADAI